jgi:hypothetical protein
MQHAEIAAKEFPNFIPQDKVEITSQSYIGALRGPDDDGLDFPPTAHPGRELLTASLFVLAIITFLVWGGWRLISVMLTSII